jgi:carbon monoxide dehydrogenase subunit G
MHFSFELPLERSREAAWKAFDNPDSMKKWQPTLESFERVSGVPGQPGAVSRLTYREGRHTMVLTETITLRREPDEFAGTYDSGMAVNAIHNRFEEAGPNRTRWIVTADFKFRGIWRLLGFVFGGAIRKRTLADLNRFKQKLEAGEL